MKLEFMQKATSWRFEETIPAHAAIAWRCSENRVLYFNELPWPAHPISQVNEIECLAHKLGLVKAKPYIHQND